MREEHLTAIQMKYKGSTYKEIAEALKLSESHIKLWFSKNGVLDIAYKDYADEQNDLILSSARNMLTSQVPLALRVLLNALTEELLWIEKQKKANEGKNDFRPDYDKAVELAEKIADRGGMSVIRKSESKVISEDTYDGLIEKLKQRGLRQSDGHREAPVATSN